MSVEKIALLVAGFDPWWMLSVALILVIVDWMLGQTEALMTLGLALVPIAALNALDINPYIQLWSYPLAVIAAYFLQRPFYSRLVSNMKSPYESIDSEIGKSGTLRVSVTEHKGSGHFYEYKDSIDGESRVKNRVDTVVKVNLQDGRVFPAIYAGTTELIDGMDVEVTSTRAGALVVKNKNN